MHYIERVEDRDSDERNPTYYLRIRLLGGWFYVQRVREFSSSSMKEIIDMRVFVPDVPAQDGGGAK